MSGQRTRHPFWHQKWLPSNGGLLASHRRKHKDERISDSFCVLQKAKGGRGAAAPRGVEDERLINKIGPGLTPPYIFEHPEAPGTLERRARLFRLAGVCLGFFVLMHRGGGGYSSWTSGLSLFYPSNGFLGWVGQKFVCRSKEI